MRSEIPQELDSSKKVFPHQEPVVGLGLDHVPHAPEARVMGEPFEIAARSR